MNNQPFRRPLDEHLLPLNMRLPFPHPEPHAMKIAIRHSFESMRPQMTRLFNEMQTQYRTGEQSEILEHDFMSQVQANNMMWDGLDADSYYAATTKKRICMMECEVLSESILMAIDGLITAVVTELTGKETCLNIGQTVVADISFDRLLDAFANFVRHRYEWRKHAYQGLEYRRQQNESIVPLAKALTGRDLAEAEAVRAILEVPMPATATLDLVCDFQSHGMAVSYQTAEQRAIDLCADIVDRYFDTWFAKVVRSK